MADPTPQTTALSVIAALIGAPATATPDEVSATVVDLIAAVADLRTRVYPALVDRCLAEHSVHLP